MEQGLIIAIDGPSGSGKSTISKLVAKALGIGYIDTGAMYRAACWWCLEQHVDLSDQQAVAQTVAQIPLKISLDPQNQVFYVNDIEVTAALREPALSQVVSEVATNLQVRAILRKKQREIIAQAAKFISPEVKQKGIVAEGRDITTVVAPDADLRILITASAQARLARRALETRGRTDAKALQATTKEVLERDKKDSQVSEFLEAAAGVELLDTSEMQIEEVVEKVLSLVAQVQEEKNRVLALRAGLDDYELQDDDSFLLQNDGLAVVDEPVQGALPVLAIIGRPNVGKSTLVNRIVGKRVAVVQDMPGVTRDRVSYQAQWAGRDFMIVDTGGWEIDVVGIDAAVAKQAELAIENADAVIFIVDATVGVTDTDERLVRLLRRSNKPVILVVNKVDSALQEADAAYFWSLGLGEPFAISALHGRGTGDALDEAMKIIPTVSKVRPFYDANSPRRIALVGRPNVGKSSLINKIAGEDRVVVNELAGTTRDPVDELIKIDGKDFIFVDTAGIRRRVHQTKGADYYASLRTSAAIDKAELGLVLIDASKPITEQDVRVIQQVIDAGRAIVIAMNKWDLVDEDRQEEIKRELEKDLVQIQWAPRFNVSAITGWHTNRLTRAVEVALTSWDYRIPTSKLNAFLGELVAAHPHPLRGGKQPRILFAAQVAARPPRFVLFASGFLEAPYRRFIENRLREHFGFEGTPIEISVRVRQKRKMQK